MGNVRMLSQKFSEPLKDVPRASLSGLSLLSAWPPLQDGSGSNCKQASICSCPTQPSPRLPSAAGRTWGPVTFVSMLLCGEGNSIDLSRGPGLSASSARLC